MQGLFRLAWKRDSEVHAELLRKLTRIFAEKLKISVSQMLSLLCFARVLPIQRAQIVGIRRFARIQRALCTGFPLKTTN